MQQVLNLDLQNLSITVSSIYLFINLSCSLDFDNFVLAQPESTDHVCQNDQFVVSGGPPIPAVCGVNTGLHSKCHIFLTCVDYLKIYLSYCTITRIELSYNFVIFYSVYVDMGLASNAPIMLTSVTSGASFSRSFSIKVTQIDCYSLSKGKNINAILYTFLVLKY